MEGAREDSAKPALAKFAARLEVIRGVLEGESGRDMEKMGWGVRLGWHRGRGSMRKNSIQGQAGTEKEGARVERVGCR